MEKPDYRKHCILFILFSILMLSGCALLTILADPFFQYHKPFKKIYYLIDNKISQNPGIARHFDYDSIILGSSMTVNFDTDLFSETMGLNTVKLSYDGAYPKDIDTIFQTALTSGNEIRAVFLGIDIFTYREQPGKTAYELPAYLYDTNILNDAPYLLNKEVLLEYIIRPQIEQEGTPVNQAYWSWPYMYYGREVIAGNYHAPTTFADPQPADLYAENISENLDRYILPYIESMPETTFTVFFPPYSVLYWYNLYAEGTVATEIAAQKQIMETLFAYPNVQIFYFQDQFSYITDLENYSDYTHYRHEMNDYMTACFVDGSHRITPENYEEVLDKMLAWCMECPYEDYLP